MTGRAQPNDPALDPASCQVDERDQRDRLAFAADFASLVNYYDLANQPVGDWQRFFLKDPTILMAAISKADPGSFYTSFSPARLGPSSVLRAAQAPADEPADIGVCDQLCSLTGNMLMLLDLWYQLLSQADDVAVLQAFIKNRIEATLASQLKNLLVLQQALNIRTRGQVRAPDELGLGRLDPLWRRSGQRAERLPEGWNVATLQETLRNIHRVVYGVFTQVVDYAAQAFERYRHAPTRYPDTALFRVFSQLMEYQQAQINRLGREHLDFYYRRVLLQAPRPAEADRVQVCLKLTAKVPDYVLPAGTAFNAGKAADGSDILFVSEQPQVLDQASVVQVLALRRSDTGPMLTGPQAAAMPASGWAAFEAGARVRSGFALGSPMLLLQQGARVIDITLGITPDDFAFAADTQYALSTAKGWMSVVPSPVPEAPTPGQCRLRFVLEATQAPVVACAGLDGIDCPWPMLKVEPGALQALQTPPKLLSVSMQVQVQGASAQVLGNDFGPLPATGSVQPFGPAPVQGQCFYLGSNEWGSKPLASLNLSWQWEGVPADLRDYYASYNDYLTSSAPPQPAVFANPAFKVDWALGDGKGWAAPTIAGQPGSARTPLFQQQGAALDTTGSRFALELAPGAAFTPDPAVALAALPAVGQGAAGYLRVQLAEPAQAFGHGLYGQVVAAVSLANAQALIRQAKAKPDGPLVRLRKAIGRGLRALGRWLRRLLRKPPPAPRTPAKDPNALQPLPNPPLSPSLAGVQAGYSASQCTDLQATADGYPLHLYHYGAFAPYLVHAAGQAPLAEACATLDVDATTAGQTALYPDASGGNCLYVEVENLVAPCTLNLLLGLHNPSAEAAPGPGHLSGFAWTCAGWRALEVLQDGTCNFNRSGIVRLRVPEGLAASPVLPGAGAWLAFKVPAEAQQMCLTWLQAQALMLRRANVAALAQGEMPLLAANAISAPQQKIDALAAVVQPLASFGGRAAEADTGFTDSAGFYPRVSRRLRHKDRASSPRDYIDMAHEACPGLYHVAVLPAGDAPGSVRLGLVNGYASAREAGAFAPRLGADDLLAIQQHLQRRASAMARIGVANLSHQCLKVQARIVLAEGAEAARVLQDLDLRLRLYLSPWIAGPQPRMGLAKGLGRAELGEVIGSCPGVAALTALQLWLAPPGHGQAQMQLCNDDPLLPAPGALLVSVDRHALALQGAAHG